MQREQRLTILREQRSHGCAFRWDVNRTWVHLSAEVEEYTGAVAELPNCVTLTIHSELNGAPSGAGYVVTVGTCDGGTCAAPEPQADAASHMVDHRIACGEPHAVAACAP